MTRADQGIKELPLLFSHWYAN